MAILVNCINIIVLIIFLIYNKKNICSPGTFFSLIWITVLVLYNFRIGLYTIRIDTSGILLVGNILFTVGYLMLDRLYKKHTFFMPQKNIENRNTNMGLCLVGVAILFMSLPYYLPLLVRFFQGYTIDENKMLIVTDQYSRGGVIMQYIVRPFEFIIVAVAAYRVTNKSKKASIDITLIILAMIFTLLELFCIGSKTHIIYFLLALLSLVDITKLFNVKEYRKHFLLIFGIILVCIISVFIVRKSIFYTLYVYATGCVVMLDNVIHDSFYWSDGLTYGFLSFNSVFRVIFKGLGIIGVPEPNVFKRAEEYFFRFECTSKIGPGDDMKYNAFTTYLSDFYIDLGWLGVIIFSFLFGFVTNYIYKRYLKEKSLEYGVLLVLTQYSIIFSIVRFQMSHTVFGLAVIYVVLYICIKRIRERIKYGKAKINKS